MTSTSDLIQAGLAAATITSGLKKVASAGTRE